MMPRTRPYLTTADLARDVGVHPNTVRLYEAWGFLPRADRSASGYRQFTERDLHLMRLARTALHGGWPGRAIRRSAAELVRRAAGGDVGGAVEHAVRHVALVRAERAQAVLACRAVEQWARTPPRRRGKPLRIAEVASNLGVSADVLRGWERNGLIAVPREARSGYRAYGPAEIARLRVIRMLLRAGYSAQAILRMMLRLDRGEVRALGKALDTPRPNEDVQSAADRWLTTLASHQRRAQQMLSQVRALQGRRPARTR